MKRSIAVLTILLGTFLVAGFFPAKAEEPEKPALMEATRPEWKIGYKSSYEITHSGYPNKVFETKEEVIAEEEFKKVLCYLISVSWRELNKPHSVTSEAYVTEDLNQKASYSIEKGSRHLSREFIPEQKTFNWPLEVGKKWKADYRIKWKTKKGYMRDKFKGVFEVERIERINVLAGEFQTFKIVLKVGRKLGVFQEWWYSPKLYRVVKGKKYWQDGSIEEYQLSTYSL